MELSQKEKDRIIAETKVRFETTRELEAQSGRGYGCHHGGFWKGLILGVFLTLLCGSVCHHVFGHHYYYGMGYEGGCPFSSCQTQSPVDTPTK